jgi:hypothetical protein
MSSKFATSTTCSYLGDVTRFSPERRSTAMRQHLLQKSNGGPGSLLLLYAGRLAPEKNLPLLIGMLRLRSCGVLFPL